MLAITTRKDDVPGFLGDHADALFFLLFLCLLEWEGCKGNWYQGAKV